MAVTTYSYREFEVFFRMGGFYCNRIAEGDLAMAIGWNGKGVQFVLPPPRKAIKGGSIYPHKDPL